MGFKHFEAGAFILKFPPVFEVYEHAVQRVLYCRLTRKAFSQIVQEKEALLAQIPDAVTRLRKLIRAGCGWNMSGLQGMSLVCLMILSILLF